MRRATILMALIVCASTGLYPSLTHAALPPGFMEQVVARGLNLPLALDYAPDGRIFIAEKGGAVRVIKDGALLPMPFLTIPTTSDQERGLLGLALDPEFAENGYVYMYYSSPTAPVKNRVSRFTASTTNPDVAATTTEVILISDIPGEHGWHNAGDLHFAADGTLYISTGDSVRGADTAQNLSNLGGKLLRINKDGSVPLDNPYAATTSPSVRKEVWNWGLRNPFRFAIDPTNGRIFINDVGEGAYEEINLSVAGGNYGWPRCEGPCSDAKFLNPYAYYSHGTGHSITGGAFYYGAQFPAHLAGAYFFGDYVDDFIKYLPAGTTTIQSFATDIPAPVNLSVAPDGSLQYLSITTGELRSILYASSSPSTTTPPTATTTPLEPPVIFGEHNGNPAVVDVSLPTSTLTPGSAPQIGVRLISERGENANGVTVRLQLWKDASLAAERAYDRHDLLHEQPRPYTFPAPPLASGEYVFKVGVYNQTGNLNRLFTDLGHIVVEPAEPPPPLPGSAPEVSIELPASTTTYSAGDTVAYRAYATDTDDGDLTHRIETTIIFHHDTHTHPFEGPFSTSTGSFTVPTIGEVSANTWFRIHTSVTDSDGRVATASRDVTPNTADLTFMTEPSGLTVLLDDQPRTSPFATRGVAGMTRRIEAPLSQTMSGRTYEFAGWSDGGNYAHSITTPATATSYTAQYRDVTPPAAPPPPAPPPPPQNAPRIDNSPRTTGSGGHIDFVGRNFGNEEDVLLTLDGVLLRVPHADGGGNFSTGSMTAPSTPGTYHYVFTGKRTWLTATSTVTVMP